MFIISPTEDLEPPVLQSFCSQDEQQLPGLPTYYCSETDERYLLWSDVQQAFEGVIYLTDSSLEGALFMIDNDGELYVLQFWLMCMDCRYYFLPLTDFFVH